MKSKDVDEICKGQEIEENEEDYEGIKRNEFNFVVPLKEHNYMFRRKSIRK